MVTSDELLVFVKERSEAKVVRVDGEEGFSPLGLAGADLAAAIATIAQLSEAEARYQLAKTDHEAHMKLHQDELDRRALGGTLVPSDGHGNYN